MHRPQLQRVEFLSTHAKKCLLFKKMSNVLDIGMSYKKLSLFKKFFLEHLMYCDQVFVGSSSKTSKIQATLLKGLQC